MSEQEAKVWWQSRTMWVNIVGAGISLYVGFGAELTEAMQDELRTQLMAGIMGFFNVANILLRSVTKTPVTTKKKTP